MNEYRQYFRNNEHILTKLEELHAKKYDLKRLIDSEPSIDPFITEFSGLPRTGKSSSLARVYDFFKKANISIEKTTEPAQIIKDSMSKEAVSRMTSLEFNDKTLSISREELGRIITQKPTIIIQDRGVIDNYFWYQMMYEEKMISAELYERILLSLYHDLLSVDQLFIMFAKPEIIIFRDYMNSIYLEDRTKTTIERVEQLRAGFEHLLPFIEDKVQEERLIKLDTSDMGEIETSIFIADKMMDGVRNKILSRKKEK